MSEIKYYAHGKLLLTGEYAVLDGANALAIPTKFGQSLIVHPTTKQDYQISWNSYDVNEQLWLQDTWPKSTQRSAETSILHKVFEFINKEQPEFLKRSNWICNTFLEFPREWGLGSSSTFLYNVSKWSNVNPYKLLIATFGGSGYDIAVAGSDLPIVYSNATKIPTIQPRVLDFSFHRNLFFVYLGKKKNSRDAIQHYRAGLSSDLFLQKINDLTEGFIFARDLQEMQEVMVAHETILERRLQTKNIKQERFADLNGAVKSLGGWGGDFVLIATSMDKKDLIKYAQSKGLKTVFSYQEMIFQP